MISFEYSFDFQAADKDQQRRSIQYSESSTHTQYRPVDFRLPVGGGYPADITGKRIR